MIGSIVYRMWMALLLSLSGLLGCQVSSLNLSSVLPANMQASALFRRGDFNAAIIQWEEALEIQHILRDKAGMAQVKIHIGMAHLELGDIRKAQHAFEEALALARQWRQQGQAEYSARQGFASGLSKVSAGTHRESLALMHLGAVHIKLGQYPTALNLLNQAARMRQMSEQERDYGRLRMYFGMVYQALGEYRRAQRDFNLALRIFEKQTAKHNETAIYISVGEIYARLGRVERARQHYEKALALARHVGHAGHEARALSVLGQLYATQGQFPQARYHLDQAFSGQPGQRALDGSH